jgi:hypothetical protein
MPGSVLGRLSWRPIYTAQGLKCLRNYRKEWNDEAGCWRDRPKHDWASHGADAYRYLSMAWRSGMPSRINNYLAAKGQGPQSPHIEWRGERVMIDLDKTGGIPLNLWPLNDNDRISWPRRQQKIPRQ